MNYREIKENISKLMNISFDLQNTLSLMCLDIPPELKDEEYHSLTMKIEKLGCELWSLAYQLHMWLYEKSIKNESKEGGNRDEF